MRGYSRGEISSFALRLAAEGKAAKTIWSYTEAVQWFAAACLPGRTSWEQADRQDIQQWMAWLPFGTGNAWAAGSGGRALIGGCEVGVAVNQLPLAVLQ